MALALTKLVSGPLTHPAVMTADRAVVVAEVRGLIVGLGWPLAVIMPGFMAGALAAHQLQVRGLCATGLLVPDLSRLWTFSSGPGLAVRVERAGWSMVKAVVVIMACAWAIRAGWTEVLGWAASRGQRLARVPAMLCSTLPGCWRRFFWSWDSSTMGSGTGGSSRCCARRARSNGKIGASWKAIRPREPSGGGSPGRCAATRPNC